MVLENINPSNLSIKLQSGSSFKKIGLIAGLFLVVVIIAFIGFRYKQELDKLKTTQHKGEVTEASGVTDLTSKSPGNQDLPFPEKLSNCYSGSFPETEYIRGYIGQKGWIYGNVASKGEDGELTLKVEQILKTGDAVVGLSDVKTFELREVLNREAYAKGTESPFRHTVYQIGDPYTIGEIYKYLPVGAHVWVFDYEPEGHDEDQVQDDADNRGKTLWVYCDA